MSELNLSIYDMHEARTELYAYVRDKATSWGMDPDIECQMLTPEQSEAAGYGKYWMVMWEAGPYKWGVDLSAGNGVTFMPMDDEFDREKPEVTMGRPQDWYLESWAGYDVVFVPLDELYSEEILLPSSAIITTAKNVERDLIHELSKHPELLKTIDRRVYEKLVAELFNGFGYDVELLQQTRDGGKDIVAVKSIDSIDLRYLIECKRPDPGNKVSVSTVRELLGVKSDDPASKAILATTTEFTRDANCLLYTSPSPRD